MQNGCCSSNNQLTGSIPSSLGSLTNLEVLQLGDNQLTGFDTVLRCAGSSLTINLQQGGVNLPCGEDDGDNQAVLVELYNATNGPNWTNNTNWNSSSPLDQWYGVFTDEVGRVTQLNLGEQPVDGFDTVRPWAASRIWCSWFLSGNQLTGSIPSSAGQPHESGVSLSLFDKPVDGFRYRPPWAASRV